MVILKKVLVLIVLLSCSLSAETRVLAFSGSTRANSTNTKLVKQAAQMARHLGAEVIYVDLKKFPMPFYDEDLESSQGLPENAQRLRSLMKSSQAIIISTPEYNGSVSAVLKNTLDWASRDEDGKPSRDAFKGKKFAILSASPGPGGASRAAYNLKTIIESIGGEVVSTRLSVPNSYDAFDKNGRLRSRELEEQLKQEIQEVLR